MTAFPSGDHDDPIVISSPVERRSEKRGEGEPRNPRSSPTPHIFADSWEVGTWIFAWEVELRIQESLVYNRRICKIRFSDLIWGLKKTTPLYRQFSCLRSEIPCCDLF